MRCSCGKPATIQLPRRELPYCESCFEHLIVTTIRHEAGEQPVALRPIKGYFLDAVQAACKLARRETALRDDGAVPGCTETQAAAVLKHQLGRAPNERHFPNSITLQELQTFFKATQPVQLDTLTQELITFDQQYPGTTRSIAKQIEQERRTP